MIVRANNRYRSTAAGVTLATGVTQTAIWELRLAASPAVGVELYYIRMTGIVATAAILCRPILAHYGTAPSSGTATAITGIRPVHPGMSALHADVTHQTYTTGPSMGTIVDEIAYKRLGLLLSTSTAIGAEPAAVWDYWNDPQVITGGDDSLVIHMNLQNFTNAPSIDIEAHFGTFPL